ncbi:hypothetical protein [Dermabacter vaginalis]|uniref:hypothetical protein n=1 Tax=Dermabacter vaginalis TaxID=1630135 RepID=UPI0012FA1A47|nr:hypothetical protein [Dermabacter vaginalis]
MDFPSAAIRARATGQRVEVTAERSESSTTWVNPDGSVTTEQFAAPVRFKNDKGEWASFNTDLVEKADGSLAPASVPEGVVLAGEVNGTDAQPAEVASLSGGAADSQISGGYKRTRITENGTYHHYKNRGYNMENKIRPCRYRNCR